MSKDNISKDIVVVPQKFKQKNIMVVFMKDFFQWMDDKNLIVIIIGALGCMALLLKVEGSVPLIEKMTYGLLGMAVGKQIGGNKK